MPRAELRHRLKTAARRRLGWLPWLAAAAVRDDGWVARTVAAPDGGAGLPDFLAGALAARIYGRGWTPARLAEGLVAAGAADRIVAEANDLLAHRVRVFGYGLRHLGDPIDWHRDPVTGAAWPRRYWGRMSHPRASGLDLKVIWEPGRHQHLAVLAAAAALTGEDRYADEVAAQLAGWIEQNPIGVGVHWLESLEPALRILAWLWVLPLVLGRPRFTPVLCATVLRSLVAQARHIAANLSLYSSPNTHLLGEALALFVVGTVLPELDAAAAWRERGRAILEREIVAQVGADGVYREASLYYHAYTVECYLLAVLVAERNGAPLAPIVRVGLERMLEALAWLVRPDGRLPNVGDADGGRTLRLGAPNLTRVDELLASGALLFQRAELRAGLASRGEEAAWLWPDAVSRLDRLGSATAPHGCRQFPDARLAVDRSRVDGDERWALFDAGDLGMLAGGHGHAGCLGLELYAHGRLLVADRGTYLYNGAPAWRAYFRSTRAHSTVVLDGCEQAEPSTPFQWATRYRSRVVRRLSSADYTLVTGEHDAYGRLREPVRHRRTLLSVGGAYWLCVDVLDGAGRHTAEFLFQLAAGLEAESVPGGVFAAPAAAAHGLLLLGAGFADATCRIVTGATDPIQGWQSDDYGDKRPAPTLCTTESLQTPAVRVHVLAPCARSARGELHVESERVGDGLAVIVRTERSTDLVLCSPTAEQPLAARGVELVGELLHARMDPAGALQKFLAVQARSVRWHGDALVQADGPGDWVRVRRSHATELVADGTPTGGKRA
jgi:Heparinase II/III-like protein/Heparinase II/III N-terminus